MSKRIFEATTKEDEEKERPIKLQKTDDKPLPVPSWRFRDVCPKVLAWPDVPEGACGICLKPIVEDEPMPVGEKGPMQLIRNYSGHNFTTSNPPMAEARVYRPFCFSCWSKHYTPAIVVDGFYRYFLNHYSTLHVVSNWHSFEDIKVERSSGKIDQKCKLVTQYFDEKEKQVSFINFNTFLGEPMLYLWTDDPHIHKCLYLSDIQKLNPHLPPFQWRFPNRVPFHTIIQWLHKPPFPSNKASDSEWASFRDLHKLFYLSEWYNPEI